MLTLTPMAAVRAVALYVLILFTTFYVGLSFFLEVTQLVEPSKLEHE